MTEFNIAAEDIMPRMRAYLTRAGYQSLLSEVPEDIMSVAREIYKEALPLAEPMAAVAEYEGLESRGTPLPDVLKGCAYYTLMLFSIGRKIDSAIERYFSDGEPLRGLLMDSWGSESVESLAGNIDALLRSGRGPGTIRFAPGYSGFDIRHNSDWLSLIKERRKGDLPVSVDAGTGIISPRKSIICAIGWQSHY